LVRSQLVGAALVSENELPGHLERCSLVVPVEGLEDVLILCLNLAPLSTVGVLLGILSLGLFRLPVL
jgi:hypothetical protein